MLPSLQKISGGVFLESEIDFYISQSYMICSDNTLGCEPLPSY